MSLSFVSGTWSLSTWGFGVSDIALLSGAGRNVGTWLMANYKDRTLFDFLQTDVDTLLTRRGLLDTTDLHKRWDQLFILMKNDRRTTFKITSINGAPQTIQHMDRFTWLMVLFTAALDVSMQDSDLRETLCLLMLHLLEDQDTAHDFVRHEINHHVSGWRSAAVVRGITMSARHHWTRLAMAGTHQPGFVPKAEMQNVVHFLGWIANGPDADKIYSTSSTDIFSLAEVLRFIGLSLKTCDDPNGQSMEENMLTVVWIRDMPFTAAMNKAKRQRRTGIRIPLNHIQEVASVHPSDRNEIRAIFEQGMHVIAQDRIRLRPAYTPGGPPDVSDSFLREGPQDIVYHFHIDPCGTMPRLEGDAFRLITFFFPYATPTLARNLLSIITQINKSEEERHNLEMLVMTFDNDAHGERYSKVSEGFDFGNSLDKLQAFVLGYWYALLLPWIDASQTGPMSRSSGTKRRNDHVDRLGQEAYGSWCWSDRSCLTFIRDIADSILRVGRAGDDGSNTVCINRLNLLKAASYLFGGCEPRYIQDLRSGAVGMHGKLTILYSSLIGCKLDDVGKFCLLEIDPSCIPSSTSGIIFAGVMNKHKTRQPDEFPTDTFVLTGLSITSLVSANNDSSKDFTLHIEPDWDNDVQRSLVTYRQGGRIVTRLNPCQIDVALLRTYATSSQTSRMLSTSKRGQRDGDVEVPLNVALDLRRVPCSALQGFNKVVVDDSLIQGYADGRPRFTYTPIVFDTMEQWNARVCILCIYTGWQGDSDVAIISSQQELEKAIVNRKRVLIVREPEPMLNSSHGKSIRADDSLRLSVRTRGFAR